jgi:hypothetical protein
LKPKGKEATPDKMTVKLLTIYASTDFYSFDPNTGEKINELDLNKVDELKDAIALALQDRDTMFKLDGKFDSVTKKYNDRQEKIKKKEQTSTKKSTKK